MTALNGNGSIINLYLTLSLEYVCQNVHASKQGITMMILISILSPLGAFEYDFFSVVISTLEP